MRSEDLEQRVIQVLWEKFAMKLPGTTVAESRGALVLLGMAAGCVKINSDLKCCSSAIPHSPGFCVL